MNKGTLLVLLLLVTGFVCAQNTGDTRLLHSPAVSEDKIAFIYAEDLWTANKDGSDPRRLTIDEGVESNPVFSPDGSMIAFSAQYDGNTDVFIVPTDGGIPRRLTWHPSWDYAADFTPDGQHVVFNSRRTNYTRRHAKLYTVSTGGGQVMELPIPTAYTASMSNDGQFIAYNPNTPSFTQWKNYRGGTQSRIWIYDNDNSDVVEIPKPAGGANDWSPQWMNRKVYFRSDRNGEFNLYSFDPSSQALEQLTDYEEHPVLNLSTHGDELIYEQGGYLHLFDATNGSSTQLEIGIATDLLEMRSRFVSGAPYIRSASISPSGARVAFDFRGDVVTIPAEKGDVSYLTATPGAHEKYPVWSNDGGSLAYFSDADGEYALHIRSMPDGSTKKVALDGTGFYAFPQWSPDDEKIAFVDNGRNLYFAEIATGSITKVATDALYVPGAFRYMFGSWSHDSRWLSYTIVTETNFEQAFAYSLPQKASFALSDGLSNVSEPVFDPSGKYLYMLASTDAGPVVNWFDQSNQDMEMTTSIYLVTLQKELISPLAKENDTEEGKQTSEEEEGEGEEVPDLRIDWESIADRIISLPIGPGMYRDLVIPAEGELYYISRAPHSGFGAAQPLMKFDLKSREAKEVTKASQFWIATQGKKMLLRNGNNWSIAETGKKPANGNLKVGEIQVKIDPVLEWANIFDEAWRVNRDYFYDPGMHGLDWDATKAKYEAFLPDVVCRSDLYRVMQWMCSELAVGHHRFGSRGDRMRTPERVGVGLLGADYEIRNNRYQFAKIYGGLNWNPDLRSPLTEPGVNIKEGEYLLAVNGEEVTQDQNLYSFFENQVDKIVTLRVGPSPTGSSAREVKVVPIANESALRNRDWVEGNIKKVEEATDGQVAYVYVPNTAGAGHEYFKRYFFPQADKKAIIVDERHNGGGQLADYYIDILRKPYQAHWNFRYGQDLKAPSASIQGPKVMLIDETAGSGGDYLPWMFRKFGLGKLIGKTTWGGLVGVLGYPEFIDGGSVTAPNVAFYSEEGFRIENEGIAPDIEIEQWPKEVMEGRDPQLEKAIEVVLEELEQNPPTYPDRPEYPVRVREGGQ